MDDLLYRLLNKVNNTQPDLKTILLLGLQDALLNSNYDMTPTNQEVSFKIFVYSQNGIGWSHLLCSCFSHCWWAQLQQTQPHQLQRQNMLQEIHRHLLAPESSPPSLIPLVNCLETMQYQLLWWY
jgi:hypothetical protein